MPKEELHAALMERIAEYRSLHSRTLDIDMRISEALSKGDTITKVSINTPCDISTVYRSIIRIEKFLQGETDNIDVLKGNYTVSNAIIQGRWTQRSLLGMKLYMCLLVLHQQRRNSAAYNTIRKYCPGLRNSKQRKVVLEELNNLSVLTYEENEKTLRFLNSLSI